MCDQLYLVYRKAEEGFKFCAASLQKNIEDGQNDQDTLMLWALAMDWYARFLVDVNRLPEALEYFKKTYDLCVQINGVDNEEVVAVLNDLGTICFVQNDIENALSYLTQAVAIGNKLPDMENFGSVLINLGTVYMKKGMVEEATQVYQEAWTNAKKHKNVEVLKQANSCLDEVKSSQSTQQ
jgi:tetratricopeptide repeat protein 19